MTEAAEMRVAMRRETYDLKEKTLEFTTRLRVLDAVAADAAARAYLALFEVWTILCTPPNDDDDEH